MKRFFVTLALSATIAGTGFNDRGHGLCHDRRCGKRGREGADDADGWR